MKQLGLALSHQPPRKPRRAALRAFFPKLETVQEALAGEARANRQEQRILEWMRSAGPSLRPGEAPHRWTPTNVWLALGGADRFGPKTSVRRALTNLTAKGLLRHHREDRRPGPLGARESCWSLA